MCGRFTLKTPVEQLSEKFQFPEIIPLKPRYNIAPSQSVAVVRLMPDDTDRKLAMLRWGLLPAWVKDPTKVQQPINAKAETAAEKPMFRDAFKRRRCLDRKSTRLNSSHGYISYAVFCLKKKKTEHIVHYDVQVSHGEHRDCLC